MWQHLILFSLLLLALTWVRAHARYTPARAPIDRKGRIVIVVDDGLATMVSALYAVRMQEPQRLVCAVTVGAP